MHIDFKSWDFFIFIQRKCFSLEACKSALTESYNIILEMALLFSIDFYFPCSVSFLFFEMFAYGNLLIPFLRSVWFMQKGFRGVQLTPPARTTSSDDFTTWTISRESAEIVDRSGNEIWWMLTIFLAMLESDVIKEDDRRLQNLHLHRNFPSLEANRCVPWVQMGRWEFSIGEKGRKEGRGWKENG